MSNPLREAIKKAGEQHHVVRQIDEANTISQVIPLPDEQVDAILDAVIASLPSDDYEPDEYSRGIRDVRELLQSAKSTSRESE